MIQEQILGLDKAIAQRLQQNFNNECAETLETIAHYRSKRKNAGEGASRIDRDPKGTMQTICRGKTKQGLEH